MDMDLINQQSLRLTTMILFIIFASSFYGIWSDFITVFTYLDGITFGITHYRQNSVMWLRP